MKQKELVFLFLFVLFLILMSFYFDFEIIAGVVLLQNSFLDNFFMSILFLSSKLIIFGFLTGLFLLNKDRQKWLLPLWITIGFSTIVSFFIKILGHRLRPYQLDLVPMSTFLEESSHLIWNFSFPSFHAMFVFCAVPLLSKKFPKLNYAWFVFALLTGLSRVYFGFHFLSDVLVGGFLGYLIGAIIIKLEENSGFGSKIYENIVKSIKTLLNFF